MSHIIVFRLSECEFNLEQNGLHMRYKKLGTKAAKTKMNNVRIFWWRDLNAADDIADGWLADGECAPSTKRLAVRTLVSYNNTWMCPAHAYICGGTECRKYRLPSITMVYKLS